MTEERDGVQVHKGPVTAYRLLVVQFQEVSDGLVLLLGKLEDDPARLHWGMDSRMEGISFQGEAAQISGGVWCRSERVWTGWWGPAGGHKWRRSVELEAIEDLMERNGG